MADVDDNDDDDDDDDEEEDEEDVGGDDADAAADDDDAYERLTLPRSPSRMLWRNEAMPFTTAPPLDTWLWISLAA